MLPAGVNLELGTVVKGRKETTENHQKQAVLVTCLESIPKSTLPNLTSFSTVNYFPADQRK